MICPACQTVNGEFESLCRNCGSPIGLTSPIDPVSTIQAEGFLFRKALDSPPRTIVLIGIWILFLPMFAVGVYAAVYTIMFSRGLSNFVFFWAFVGLSYIAFVILYRVTKKYLFAREK